jgi:formylglycine-generating enzyme required for sulfatase activity
MAEQQAVDITELATLGEQFPMRLMQLGFRLMQVFDAAGQDQYRYVIPPVCNVPAGPFFMGSDPQRDPQAKANELPQTEIDIPAFHIATYPLTVAEYACAVQVEAVFLPRASWPRQQRKPDHPVVNIMWRQARDYARWLAQVTGEPWRLPTEAEWEKAARSTGGRLYPWGDHWDTERAHTYASRPHMTMPVGCYTQGVSLYGVQEMTGTVWEWTRSRAVSYPYRIETSEDILGDDLSDRVLRGGSWRSPSEEARVAARRFSSLISIENDRGVRLALGGTQHMLSRLLLAPQRQDDRYW